MDFLSIIEDTGLDVGSARLKLDSYQRNVEALAKELDKLPVTTDKECSVLVGKTGEATKLLKKVDSEKLRLTKPAREYTKAVNNTAKLLTEKLGDAIKAAKGRIGQFQHRQELERRKAEEKIKKASEKLQKDLEEQAKESGVEAPKVTPAPLPKPKKVAMSEEGSTAHVRKQWKADIVDEGAVPRNYCSPDLKKINAAVKAGVREIAGVKIYEDIQTVLRT